MKFDRNVLGGARRLMLVTALTLCSVVFFSILPIGYPRFSWEVFGQPYGDGTTCADPTDCLSGFCSDGVCCNAACEGPFNLCDLEGQEGVCVEVEGVPALSLAGQIVAVLALLLGAWFGWFSRRHDG